LYDYFFSKLKEKYLMLYNFKDRALMGMKKNNIFAKERKRNTILTVF